MSKITEIFHNSIELKNKIANDNIIIDNIDKIINECTNAFQNGNAVYFCGNGGSAADSQHLAAEFSGRFYFDRKPLNSEALHVNTSYLTAVANDYSYEEIYARLIEAKCSKGDLLFGLSTSGNSKNIIKAFEKAREKGVVTIGFTGENGGKMKNLCDILIDIPSTDTPRIQECHMLIGHIICEKVEENLFSK